MVNQLAVKKLAEVRAFVELSSVIRRRGGAELAAQAPAVVTALDVLANSPQPASDEPATRQAFTAKLQRTRTKLIEMMELYVGDEWGNPVEVLEWLSFYAGAGAAHAALVVGMLEADAESERRGEIRQIQAQFWQLLTEVVATLEAAGRA